MDVQVSNCKIFDMGKAEPILAFDLICSREMMESLEAYDFIILHDIRSVKREGFTAIRLKTTRKCLQDIYKANHSKEGWKEFCDWIKEVTS
jgi:hypothetical protein